LTRDADLFPAPRLLTQVVTDIRPEPDLRDGYIERNPVVTNVQVAPDMSEHEVRSPEEPPFKPN
jgi:hypothetical protein